MSQVRSSGQGQVLDVVLSSQRPSETTQPVQQYELEILFNCFCRFPTFFAEANRVLREHHFDPGAEMPYQLLWMALVNVSQHYGVPNTETLTNEVINSLRLRDGLATQDMIDSIIRQDKHGLIWSSTNTFADDVTLAYGRAILRRFLHERTVVMPLRRMLNQGINGSYTANVDEFLEAIGHQQSQIRSMQEVPRAHMAPTLGTPIAQPSDVFKSTGIDWLDTILGGGHRVGDANGIIGVIGGGKTTTAVHMAVASAKAAWLEATRSNTRSDFVIFVTAEEPEEKVLPRIRSAAFQIPRSKLSSMSGAIGQGLTTSTTVEPYERELVGNAVGAEVLSETDRWQMNSTWLNECFELLDFSGSDRFPHAGEGFIPELVGNIDALVRMRGGQQLRAVFIDWAGILAKRHMEAMNMPDEKLRHLLGDMGGHCRRLISEKFKCTTWLAHQIKGSQLSSSPTKLFHHSDAAEASMFATELAVCMCIGVPDKESGCRRINFSKVRYRPDEDIQPVTARIHRLFSTLENVGDRYGVDEGGRRFMLLEHIRRVHLTAGVEQRAVQAGPEGMPRQRPSQTAHRVDPGDGSLPPVSNG